MKMSDLGLLRRAWRHARPCRRSIAWVFALSLLTAPIALLAPLPLKLAVDHVIAEAPLPAPLLALLPVEPSPTAMLWFVVALLLLIALLGQVHNLANLTASATAGERLTQLLRADMLEVCQRRSILEHDRAGTNDVLYRMQHDAPSARHLLVDGAIPLFGAVLTVGAMLYVTLQIAWQLALIGLAITPCLFLLARRSRVRMRAQSREVKKLESRSMSVVQEVLSSLRLVKVFGQEDREQERVGRHFQASMAARVRMALAQGQLGLFIGLTTAIGTAGVLTVGVSNVRAGTLSLGSLLLVMGYLSQLYAPLKTISRKAASMQLHFTAMERLFEVLDSEPEARDPVDAVPLTRARGEVALEGVSFGYDRDRGVLHDVTLRVPAGAQIGLVGRTGTGKTTLVGLMCRLYNPTSGQVLLDGVDVRRYRLADLRRQFAFVLQEPVLFSTTISDNIAFGRPSATHEEIVAAAVAANVHRFVEKLPNGYATEVGERGALLSGGERQRIALARAFLRDAPVLILDEPTSALDSDTEREVLDALQRLRCGRTCFVITHRQSTLANCDHVLTLRDGRLTELARVAASGGQP
ncbi:MAG TPA: ABC transporter ATP-binding protein [Planctomycetota bacterium]|nr:ABC transporter ATP-binding protein [Planctomycetota bacterium]